MKIHKNAPWRDKHLIYINIANIENEAIPTHLQIPAGIISIAQSGF